MNGVEIWVWRNGKKYMCFACERLLSDHALVPFLQAVGA